jgi:glutamate synthase domain-containing protein 1/glutamate synthase domain-containing protein 3
MNRTEIERLIASRVSGTRGLTPGRNKAEEEGGCGVTGFICSHPVRGRHIFEPSKQMHNRGNGKGGGIAAVGLDPDQMGVSREILDEYYLFQVAYLDPEVRPQVEKSHINESLQVAHAAVLPHVDDWQAIEALEVEPPEVWRYFVKPEPKRLAAFQKEHGLTDVRAAEEEFISQTAFDLSRLYYHSGQEQRAFVMSYGRDLMILKAVGYAEGVVQYYEMEDVTAHVWIAHQRYPTKGRVWHPGGAHPFAGVNMALVHNGDFANYHSVSEYLAQQNLYPLFMTDTEVSALMFDLLTRTYGYPMEYVIESLAPTAELDLDQLPVDKQAVYTALNRCHVHGSPDGPWFFIIARNDATTGDFQLIGVTDTAMLRPQVFALHEGEVQLGLICSEKQAIDATLRSLSEEDGRVGQVADKYWNARGGSYTDGGAFIFRLEKNGGDGRRLICTDKFGVPVSVDTDNEVADVGMALAYAHGAEYNTEDTWPPEDSWVHEVIGQYDQLSAQELTDLVRTKLPAGNFDDLASFTRKIFYAAESTDERREKTVTVLTDLLDARMDFGNLRPRSVREMIGQSISDVLSAVPVLDSGGLSSWARLDWETRELLRAPQGDEAVLVIDAQDFPPEGDDCDAGLVVKAHGLGWRRFICYNYRGQRFLGCGLGPASDEVVIHAYGSTGDYLASGADGLTINVHGNAQDQLGQIMARGKLVVHGDVGQAFLYGAKGGEVFVLGNAAGRPMINAVGKPRVVINGTCLDYLAESFMAGDPLNGGGFVVLNGLAFDERGRVESLPTPYPGSNLFSLASGGAIYVRDPHRRLVAEQLNGGVFMPMTRADWELILPYLEENERLFGIKIDEHLLTVDGVQRAFDRVYRAVKAVRLTVLTGRETEESTPGV